MKKLVTFTFALTLMLTSAVGQQLSYDQYRELPLSQRQTLFRSMNKSQKVGLWVQHWATQLQRHDLSDEQKSFIRKRISEIASDPEMYDSSAPEKTAEWIQSWRAEMNELFTRDQAGQIFTLRGFFSAAIKPGRVPQDPDGLDQDFGTYEELEEILSGGKSKESEPSLFDECPLCACSQVDDWCTSWLIWRSEGECQDEANCTQTEYPFGGCGLGGVEGCDGWCSEAEEDPPLQCEPTDDDDSDGAAAFAFKEWSFQEFLAETAKKLNRRISQQ